MYLGASSLWRPSAAVYGAVVGGPSLDLNFLSGSLPSAVTFTRSGTAWSFNSSGVLTSAATNTPRFDYDPVTLAAKGLLLEEARTNILFPSVPDTEGATWAKATNTTYLGTVTAPDGATAPHFSNSSTSDAFIMRSHSLAAATTYTFSVYARRVSGSGTGGDLISLAYDNGGYTRATLTVAAAGITSTWARYSVTFTNVNAVSDTVFLLADTGDIGQIALWGAQLEAGNYATSYIPTTSGSATRAAEVAIIPVANIPGYTTAGGTMLMDYTQFGSHASTSTALLSLDDGTTNNRIQVRRLSTATPSLLVATGGVVAINTGLSVNLTGDLTLNVPHKLALAYATNDAYVYLDGVSGTAAGTFTVPTMTRIAIGSGTSLANLSAHIPRIRVYNTRKSNAELQALTA